jgi:hypothetical protein
VNFSLYRSLYRRFCRQLPHCTARKSVRPSTRCVTSKIVNRTSQHCKKLMQACTAGLKAFTISAAVVCRSSFSVILVVLAMARYFSNFYMKNHGFICTPETYYRKLSEKDKYVSSVHNKNRCVSPIWLQAYNVCVWFYG